MLNILNIFKNQNAKNDSNKNSNINAIIINSLNDFTYPREYNNNKIICFDKIIVDIKNMQLAIYGWISYKDKNSIQACQNNITFSKRPDVEALYPNNTSKGFLINTQFNCEGSLFNIDKFKFNLTTSAIKSLLDPEATLQDIDTPNPMWMSFHNGPAYDNCYKSKFPKYIAFYHNNIGKAGAVSTSKEAWQYVKPFKKTDINFDVENFDISYGYDFQCSHILKKQVELANFYGIYGWAFIYPNFSQHLILDDFLHDSSLQIKYCIALCEAINDWKILSKYFTDNRYIRIDSKPVIVVIGDDIYTIVKSLSKIRNNIFLITQEKDTTNNLMPDAIIQNPNIDATHLKKCDLSGNYNDYINSFDSHIISYDTFTSIRIRNINKHQYQIVSTDKKLNSAEINGYQFLDTNPEKFRHFLCNISEIAYDNFESDRNFVFIDSWNDWIHNTKLEPDYNYGYGYLHAVKDVVEYKFDKRAIVVLKNDYSKGELDFLKELCYQLNKNFKYKLIYLIETQLTNYINFVDETHIFKSVDSITKDEIVNTCNAYKTKNIISIDILISGYNNVHIKPFDLIKNNKSFIDYTFNISDKLGHKFKKVSVAVPNYKYIDYLPARIDSICKQSYPLYEVLLMDDASNDGSERLYNDYVSRNPYLFKKFINCKNSGSGYKQWKKAFEISSGEYLWIAEADDFSKQRFLEKNMNVFSHDDKIDIVWSRSCLLNKEGQCILPSWYPSAFVTPKGINTKHWENDYVYSGYDEIAEFLTIRNTILNVSSVVFKLKDYSAFLEKSAKFKIAGDWYLYVSILSKGGNIGHCADNLNCYTLHEDSTSLSNCDIEHFKEIEEVQNYAASLCNKEDIPNELVKAERDNIIRDWHLDN